MEKIVLIDTNLYLDDANIIYKMAKQYNKILIPITVLKELDKKKYNKDLSYSARNAIRAIQDFTAHNLDQIIFDTEKFNLEDPDDRILASAQKFKAVVATKDVSMATIAKASNIETILHDLVLNNIFDPYVHVYMEDLYEAADGDTFSYAAEYVDNDDNDDYQDMLAIFSKVAGRELSEDFWWFVIININTNRPIIYANNPLLNKLIRIDNKSQYREICVERDNKVKALDEYQVCAIYAMVEAPNTIICGSYGSGKSLLSTAYGLAHNDKKTFISRPNLTVDSRFSLGFLPGNLKEKLAPWMLGFISGLYQIFSNTKGQITDKNNELSGYDYVKEYIFEKNFEMLPLDTIQGMSFLKGDLVLLDEAQLCSISILSTILSRFGKNSKLIMTGDIKQVYETIKPSENGFLKLMRLLPHKYMAYVELKNNYRSELIELADQLQNKNI